jgi:hypothetical protein
MRDPNYRGSFDASLKSKKYGSPDPMAQPPIGISFEASTERPGSASMASDVICSAANQITSAPSPDLSFSLLKEKQTPRR